jgi:hypothetical protein
MTNKDLARAYAEGATSGSNSNGTMLIQGNAIYSYGHHWPIARRYAAEKVAYINGDKVSVTTSRHTGLVASQLSSAGYSVIWASKAELEEVP